MNLNLPLVFKVLLVLGFHYVTLSEARSKYNVTMGEMATCKEYDLRGTGYIYTDFFQVHTLDNNKLGPNERLHLKFYVMTSMDAHILLSVNNRPRLMDRVYEVVIGAGGNTFSTIRTSMGRRRVATNQDPHLLSVLDPTPIEIVQMKDGNLLVYISGYKEGPLLNFTDASALNINYISFSTFGSITARWFYDCEFDGFDAEIEQETRPLTPQQRLIANITAKAENATAPQTLRIVNFAFQIRSVAFKQKSSFLQTRLNLILYWEDASLQWNPKDFNGIDAVVQPTLGIWKPKMVILNGALETLRHFNPAHEIKVYSNGSVSLLASNAELTTWCNNRAANWPNEEVQCELALGLDVLGSSAEAPLELEYDSTKPMSKEPISTLSEWQFVKLAVARITSGALGRFSDDGVKQTMQGDVSIEFTMVRNGTFYRNVFTMPILAGQTLLILSFLLRGYRRGALILVVFVIISLGLMFITWHAPPSYIPNIMAAYQNVMRVATFSYILHIIICWLEQYPPKDKPCNWIMSIINSSPLRLMLCMRFSDSTEYVDIQEHPWREIAKILNNVSFIVVNILFIAIDVLLL